jgi:magnesium-transporting ATPase (P-type)
MCKFAERMRKAERFTYKRRNKMLGTILIVVVILLLLGALPTWPHSRQWGYYPSGGLGLILLVLIILMVLGLL